MHESRQPILIVGGTGKTGHRVAAKLAARGVETRVASRSGETIFDWNDMKSWRPALDGVSAVYLTYFPDLAVPEAPPAIEEFTRLSAERGVERLVLLSGRGEEEAQRCERILLRTNPSWTVVRASWFNQNFSEGFFTDMLRDGVLRLPAGDVREPFIDADDIADVAVAALTETGHEGQIYEVTGPRLMTFAEAVEDIARATGRELRYEQIPVDDYVDGMLAQQVPEQLVSLTQYLFETVLDGRNASTTDGVQRALGRDPRDFADFARETARTGVWAVSGPGEVQPAADNGSAKDANKKAVLRFVDEFINRGDASALHELIHSDYVYRSPGEELRGLEGLAALFAGYRSAFPDLALQIDDLVATDDATVMSFTLTGTHRGDLLGISATGRRIRVNGMVRSRFRDGKIAEEWEILDQLSLFEQLGVVGGAA
ncbi:MAG: ester cyclase [Thermoanaerobaculales bacterium]|jgi:steroid delta-isomerase-like uncharacterized protein|nr:ester cyclase [Thermoanaerobaculales bacterium]